MLTRDIIVVIVACLVIINIIGMIVVAADKNAAKRKEWRTPEKTFFIIALLGGSLGVYTGMQLFRHKTKHWYFVLGIPAIGIIEIAAVVACFALHIL